jgi:UDP-N-acetylmuramoylalanine--D-glutamate ligase
MTPAALCPPPPALSRDRILGARVLVVGMERSGVACAELLSRHGAEVLATDLEPREGLPAPFRLQSDAVFEGRDLIVISPGVPCDLEPLARARERGVPVIGDVELASYFLEGPIIGITGSNGKTTTTALAGHLLREAGVPAQVGGNIGTAVTAMVDSSRPEQWNVLELSSFQLETIAHFRAQVSVCLNVTPDHLDRHHTFEVYAAAKRRIVETQRAGDFAVLNAADPTCVSFAAYTAATPVWFSAAQAGDRVLVEGTAVAAASDLLIRGRHNLENALAAAVAAHLAGAPLARIGQGLRTFRAVEHRLEFVRSAGGVDFYNDSKATNVDATLKALDAFPGNLWVILGGKDKGSDYTPLRQPLKDKAKGVMLIGAAAPKIRAQVEGAAPLYDCGVIGQAIAQAYRAAARGDTVLLAPACASFDQFTNYEHRGRVFKEIVNSLEEK